MFFLRKPQRKLKNILIYLRFQLGLIGGQAVFLVIAFLGVQLMNLFSFRALADMGRGAGLAPQHSYFGFITEQSHDFFWRTLAVFVVVLLASSLCTLILSFRLAGPIYRLRKHMQQIADQGADGLDPLRFRNGDFYSDLPVTVNQAIERLKRNGSINRATGS